jgi:NIMA (never in mitosis gene a)-related kinase
VFSHPNIISYKEAFIDEPSQSLCLVMEYADDADLLQNIEKHEKEGKALDENQFIWPVFVDVCRGLRVLHQMKIFHRDLKSANVFLYKNGTAKLGDLNVSKVAKRGMLYT